MDIMQLIRISLILGLLAVLDFLVYLIALKFNSYYRHKFPVSKILKMELEKGLEPLNTENVRNSNPGPSVTASCVARKETAAPRPAPVRDIFTKILDAPAATDKPLKREIARSSLPASQKFRLDDKVELYGSRGELRGNIISCNDRNSKSEYRYLVDWGKDGIWWVSEDQIEPVGQKRIEINA